MTKKTVVIIVALTLLISLFSGCKDNLIERLEKVQAEVEISVKLPPGVAPAGYDPEDFVYTLTFYPVGDPAKKTVEDFKYDKNLVLIYKFDPGEYTFELKATDAADPNIEKASGKASIPIKAGQKEKLEINLTYYIYGDDKGFTAEPGGILRLSGDLTFADGQIISIPSDMKLVIDEGCTITVPAGKTLEFSGVVEALGDFTVQGNLTLDGALHAKGDLSVTGGFESKSGADVVVDNALAVGGSIDVDGHVKVGSVEPQAGSSTLTATVQPTGVFEVSTLDPQYDKVTVNGNGTLAVTEDASLKEIELAGTSSLTVGGTLKGKDGTGLNVSGTGALSAGSVVSDKLTTQGDQAITADSFIIQELAPEAGTTLTLNGDVTTGEVSGSVQVNGTVTSENLAIKKGATLEVDGTLTSGSLSGDGSITADDIRADEIVLKKDEMLTLNGETTTAKISGSGRLVVHKIVGTEDKLVIEGTPTITGDLTLQPDTTIAFADDSASLTVKGDVKAWGNLTLEGNGVLAVDGDLTVEGVIEGKDESELTDSIDGDIYQNTIPLGKKPNLVVYIKTGDELTLVGDLDAGWKTVTVIGGGTLKVGGGATLSSILLEDGSKLEFVGVLKGVAVGVGNSTEIEISGDGELTAGSIVSDTLSTKGDQVITAGSIEADKLSTLGDQTIKAGSFNVTELAPVAGTTLTLIGDVTTENVSGDVLVDGTVTAKDLSIANGATLEASKLSVDGDTLTINDGGTLKVSGDTDLSDKEIVLEKNSKLVIDGTLTSKKISGVGTITADNTDVATIDTGVADNTITLEGDVTVATVTGKGTAKVEGAVTPVDSTFAIAKDATLEASRLDESVDSLTITDGGTLKITDETTATTLGAVDLQSNSTLIIAGALTGTGGAEDIETTMEINVSGVGTIEAGSVFADTLSSNGTPTIKVAELKVKELSPDENSTLTISGPTKTNDNLTLSGEGTVAVVGKLAVEGALIINETGVDLDVTNGTITTTASVVKRKPDLIVHIVKDEAVSLDSIEEGYTNVIVTGGGTLYIEDESAITLSQIELKDKSNLVIVGPLKGAGPDGATEIKVSGNGELTADSVIADKLSTVGDQTITADNFTITKLAPDNGKILTLIGDVSTETVSGNVTVDGTVTAGNLSIAAGATLEATNLAVVDDDNKEKNLTLTGGGSLEVETVADTLDAISLGDNSVLDVTGKLSETGDAKLDLSTNATITLGPGTTLTVDGPVKSTGDITLSGGGEIDAGSIEAGKLTTVGNQAITANPINVGEITSTDGTLTLKGDVTTEEITGKVKIEGDLTVGDGSPLSIDSETELTVTGDVNAIGDLTLSGTGALNVGGDLTVDGTLISTDTTANLHVTSGTIFANAQAVGTPPNLVVHVKEGETLSLENIPPKYTSVTVIGGGTLYIEDDSPTTLAQVVLDNGSKLELKGALEGAVGGDGTTEIKVSGNGELTAGSVVTDTLTTATAGDSPTITADTFVVKDLAPKADTTLTLNGDVTTEKVSGTVIVNGTVTADDLSIDSGTTLEATGLVADTVTVRNGGALHVNGNATVTNEFVLETGADITIGGTLDSGSISGTGELTAGSVTTDTLNNTGNLTINSDSIITDEILLKDNAVGNDDTLTLNGNLTTGQISGNGNLEAGKIVGSEDILFIDGTPTVKGDLTLVADTTLSFKDNATLTVAGGDVKAWGGLTLEGSGKLTFEGVDGGDPGNFLVEIEGKYNNGTEENGGADKKLDFL